ncbi:hypothetical protein BDZ85DRAFT_31763 [Elsinoe ampelina]|uniref:AHC1-like C2H2 zinc-finger domain-containing protein n=1 Tax=Elsinoe ampelina TaxID=302913 RepID=A0A6A6G2X3_9PEZI|nr:hypothetical protein BDZ85DRAFT_31763 [Elsinoe ampelina]
MQSIFRLPWCSEPLGGEKQDVLLQKMRPSPIDIPIFNKLKRKRSDSPDFLQDVKRKRPCETDSLQLKSQGNDSLRQVPPGNVYSLDTKKHETVEPSAQGKMDDGAPLTALVASDLSPLQQTIVEQFNLEILLKHREVRTIEQELAKCQVALEQLRRCEIIPYPGQDISADVSTGTGPSLRAASGFTQPAAPAPWGVVDGPYSKHYSSWLIPDSTFDSVSVVQTPTHDPYSTIRGDRSTRNTGASWAKPVKSRLNRESISFSPQAPVAQAPSRNKGGPLVLKRMSDNQFVKLVCTKCHRSDFSSVQGFLNHCRIAHKIDYKSHEAAAQDCGHLLEAHEADLAATAPPPVGTTVRTPAPKPTPAAVPAPVVPTTTKVHALNQEFIPRPTWKRQRLAYVQELNSKPAPPASQLPRPANVVSSAAAPFLSSHLAKRGVGVNLAAIIAKLGEKIDLGPESFEEVEDSQGTSTPVEPVTGARTVSGKLDRPGSRKAFHQSGNRPRPAPLSTPLSTASMSSDEIPESPQENELSPHTADSNPGLVSDHEDDPVSDPEETGSVIAATEPIRIHSGCGDAMDLDVEVDDDHDGHGVIIRSRGSMQDDTNIRDAGSPSRSRSKFGRREK